MSVFDHNQDVEASSPPISSSASMGTSSETARVGGAAVMGPKARRNSRGRRPSHASRGQGGEVDQLTRSVAKLISETAHDLRSPLTTVREAVRLVHSGDLGELNSEQRELLDAAMDQCDCLDSMIGEMVQLERLRTGAPRAKRDWVSLSKVRASVDETLRPWALPRQIDILWDLTTNPNTRVYADVSMMRRLIVNLVVNAIRASRDGQCVLIRFRISAGSDHVECSVIDQGSGISHQDLQRLTGDRGVSIAHGEGLGLSICRQLAAVHFSSLSVRSRPGDGTEASFCLPASGPLSVASAWVRWRLDLRMPRQKPRHVSADQTILRHDVSSARPVPRQSNSGAKQGPAGPASAAIQLRHQATRPRFEDVVAIGKVSLGAAMSREAAAAFETTLQNHTQMFDLVYKVDQRTWVWIFDADARAASAHIDLINDHLESQDHSIRTTWSEPQMVSLDPRHTLARISDLLVRQTLSSASAASHMVLDQDEVRPGTAPLQPSFKPSNRLDQELNRLGQQMRNQADRLQNQSRKLRPHGLD